MVRASVWILIVLSLFLSLTALAEAQTDTGTRCSAAPPLAEGSAGPVVTSTELTVAERAQLADVLVADGQRLARAVTTDAVAGDLSRFDSASRLTITSDGLEYEAFSLLDVEGAAYEGVLLFSPIPKVIREELTRSNVSVPWSVLTIASGDSPRTIRLALLGRGDAQEFAILDNGSAQALEQQRKVETNINDTCIGCVKDLLFSVACEAAAITISCATGFGCPGSIMSAVIKQVIGETCSQVSLLACAAACAFPTISLSPASNSNFTPSTIAVRISVSGGGTQGGTWLAILRGLQVVHFKLGVGSTDVFNWPATSGTYRIVAGNIPLFGGFPWAKSSSNIVVTTANLAPTANFSFTTNGLAVTFLDASNDPDGSIKSRAWNFGDGTSSTATNPTKTYSSGGTRNVSLTVTDSGGKSGSVTKPVTVSTTSTCTGTNYVGTLSSGASAIQPNGNYYYSAVSGTHTARLIGPSGTDFDLYLYRWNGSAWASVASSRSYTSSENVTYTGSAGYYYWLVRSYSGSGTYSLCARRP